LIRFSVQSFPQNPPYQTVASLDLVRREPAHNRLRFYAIAVTPSLLGSWAMVREWGRIGRPAFGARRA